jgi:hypothetical protein
MITSHPKQSEGEKEIGVPALLKGGDVAAHFGNSEAKGDKYNRVEDYAKAYRDGVISPVDVAKRTIAGAVLQEVEGRTIGDKGQRRNGRRGRGD